MLDISNFSTRRVLTIGDQSLVRGSLKIPVSRPDHGFIIFKEKYCIF